jgi:serpin B
MESDRVERTTGRVGFLGRAVRGRPLHAGRGQPRSGRVLAGTEEAPRRRGPLVRRSILLGLLLMVGSSCGPGSGGPGSVQRPPVVVTADVRSIAANNDRFALELYGRLRTMREDNLVFSPASLSTALAMTYAGARGKTAEEMARVLHFDLPPEKLHAVFGDLLRAWDAEGKQQGCRLVVANRLWGQQGFHFLPGFLDVTRDRYGAELAQVDFAGKAESARERINGWVEEKTQGKIHELVPSGVLDGTTRLVLTNAIDFKGMWTDPFLKPLTKVDTFHVPGGRKAEVPLMYQEGHFRYTAGDGLKLLELPYANSELAMVLLLPDAVDGLPALEARLTGENLYLWQAGLRPREVKVFLPRFTLESRLQLADTLEAMGLSRAFKAGEADLSGIAGDQGLFLSAAIQKAFIDVNEEGTEAAAATDINVKATEAIEGPPVFRADHPFLFMIRDRRTGSLLFLGRLVNPGS